MNNPQISVIMSVYKEPIKWLCQSVESILQQTFKNYEFIIICDNPSYVEGKTLLGEYAQKDKRIILLHNEENVGLTKSLNRALVIARGRYIARMDADDVSMPDRLVKQYTFMEKNPNVDVCGTNIKMFGELGFFSVKEKKYPQKHSEVVSFMLFDNPIAHPTAMFRHNIHGKPVQYDEKISKAQDFQLWYDLKEMGAQFSNIQDICLCYRISKSQISSTSNRNQKEVANNIRHNMLQELFSEIEENTIIMHNEICNLKKTATTISKKKEWMRFIRKQLKNKGDLTFVIEKELFTLWMANCSIYSDKWGVLQYPSKNIKLYFNNFYFNNFIKLLIK